MYNEIKLLVEKIFTLEQYMINMRYKTPDIIDYTLRLVLNENIGDNNTIVSELDGKYIIINLNEVEYSCSLVKDMMYKGKRAILISINKNIRDDDYDPSTKIKSIFIIFKGIIKKIFKEGDISLDLAATILTMDLFINLYNEKQYILNYFIEKHIIKKKLIEKIYRFIIENDNASYKLLDEFEIAKLVSVANDIYG